MSDFSTSKEDLVARITELVEKEGLYVPEGVLDKAAKLLELLLSIGLKCPVTVKPLPDGGIRIELSGPFLRGELDLYKEKRAELRLYQKSSDEMFARFEGEILL